MLDEKTHAVVMRNAEGRIVSSMPANEALLELPERYPAGHRLHEWACHVREAALIRAEAEREMLEKAERECPFARDARVELKEPFRKIRDARVVEVTGPVYDPVTLETRGEWAVRVVLLKNDGTPSAHTKIMEPCDLVRS